MATKTTKRRILRAVSRAFREADLERRPDEITGIRRAQKKAATLKRDIKSADTAIFSRELAKLYAPGKSLKAWARELELNQHQYSLHRRQGYRMGRIAKMIGPKLRVLKNK